MDRSCDNLVTYSDGWQICYAGHGVITKGNANEQSWFTEETPVRLILTPEEQFIGDMVDFDFDTVYPDYYSPPKHGVHAWVDKYPVFRDSFPDDDHLLPYFHYGLKIITKGIYKTSYGKLVPIQDALYIPVGKGFVIRRIDGSEPKVLSSQTKYNWHRENDSKTLVIVEDPISAICVHASGYNAMALMGTIMNDEAFSLAYHHIGLGHKIVIWLDGDDAGRRASSKAARKLLGITEATEISTTEDPKYYSTDEIKETVK